MTQDLLSQNLFDDAGLIAPSRTQEIQASLNSESKVYWQIYWVARIVSIHY